MGKFGESIKKLFGKEEKPTAAELEARRRQTLREVNDPEDDFSADAGFSPDELRQIARKTRYKRRFRLGYTVAGMILAAAFALYGLISYLVTPRPDLTLLVQIDGAVTTEQRTALENYVKERCPDVNGDGKVTVAIREVYFPEDGASVNDETRAAAADNVGEALVDGKKGVAIGSAAFLDTVSQSASVTARVPLSETGFSSQDPALSPYFIAQCRPDAAEIFAALTAK